MCKVSLKDIKIFSWPNASVVLSGDHVINIAVRLSSCSCFYLNIDKMSKIRLYTSSRGGGDHLFCY